MSAGRVALGFSGGVDSAVAAMLLKQSGYDVFCVFLDVGVKGAREDAQEAAAQLRLPLFVRDAKAELERLVCEPFARGYLEGRTLNPCLLCNRVMKLGLIDEYAASISAERIATGHYAKAMDGAIFMGTDTDKDQSYQLALMRRELAPRLLLPLGGYSKPTVRAMARDIGLKLADKPDSMDICFIPDHDYAAWIERRIDKPPAQGDALYMGKPIARHKGVHRYTVGQRWGETLNGRRLYVAEINADRNELTLVMWDELFKHDIDAEGMNWLVEAPNKPFRARVRARHTRWETPDCTVTPAADGKTVHICADTPIRAPARGQVAALYDGARLLGGGYIY